MASGTTRAADDGGRIARGFSAPAALFAVALATSAFVWVTVAAPVLLGGLGPHGGHERGVYLHAVGGTLMLLAGSLALHAGWTRRWFKRHRLFGYVYLGGGATTAVAALVLNAADPHDDIAVVAATSTLAAVWLAVSGMAWLAARNRRFDAHREWMVRSYVLTWTFVFCRLVMRTPLAGAFGDAGPAGVIWITWIIPLVACELALQWGRTGPLADPSTPRSTRTP